MRVLAFDIETAEAEALHSYGPGFIRLSGWAPVDSPDDLVISRDPAELVNALRSADAITGHNILSFDLMALASQGWIGFDEYEALCTRSFDTLVAERHLNPVAAKGMQAAGYFGLNATAARYGVAGKDTVDFEGKRAIIRRIKGDKIADRMKPGKTEGAEFSVLKVLADAYGGYGAIPPGDPDYARYLGLDVRSSAALYRVMRAHVGSQPIGSQRYIRREHQVTMSMGRVTLEGMRVDADLTMRRWSEGQQRLEDGKTRLHQRYGMPLEGKKPHTTTAGKAAFRTAVLATGISEEALDANWPMNKDGSLSTSKDVLTGFAELFDRTKPEAAELCRTILAMNGERTVYGTVLDHLVAGRVHPYIGPDQASGRWSMKNPGLTVLGKRGGKARERAMMLADNDDELLCAIDADQVDGRVIAAESQDPEYMKLFAPGMDLHSEVAFRVWPSPTQHGDACHGPWAPGDCGCGVAVKCHCEKRDQAKVFGHGFSYGLGANGMARQHGVDVAVAQNFVRGMTDAFPRLAAWKEEIRSAAGALPYGEAAPSNDSYRILHTWAGRPVRVERERAYTQATALVGQGGTRDCMAQALLNLPVNFRRKVRAVIHDEFVISIPKHDAQATAERIAESMAFDLKGIEITFGCSRVARSWAGCYSAEYEEAA